MQQKYNKSKWVDKNGREQIKSIRNRRIPGNKGGYLMMSEDKIFESVIPTLKSKES